MMIKTSLTYKTNKKYKIAFIEIMQYWDRDLNLNILSLLIKLSKVITYYSIKIYSIFYKYLNIYYPL